jgi:predicted ATPase
LSGAVYPSGRRTVDTRRVADPLVRSVVLKREDVADFAAYPFSIPAIRDLDELALDSAVTFFVGENGSGKSTLAEAIAIAAGFNPEGGSRHVRLDTRASQSPLHRHLRLVRGTRKIRDGYFLRAESFFNVATYLDHMRAEPGGGSALAPYGGKSLHEQSHGESFFALFEKRFGFREQDKPPVPGLYFLDEPEAALSPNRQLQFLALLHQYCNEGSQFVIATHSPIIMAYPESWIFVLEPDGIRKVPYIETEHYRVTKGFFDHPKKMMGVLFG